MVEKLGRCFEKYDLFTHEICWQLSSTPYYYEWMTPCHKPVHVHVVELRGKRDTCTNYTHIHTIDVGT